MAFVSSLGWRAHVDQDVGVASTESGFRGRVGVTMMADNYRRQFYFQRAVEEAAATTKVITAAQRVEDKRKALEDILLGPGVPAPQLTGDEKYEAGWTRNYWMRRWSEGRMPYLRTKPFRPIIMPGQIKADEFFARTVERKFKEVANASGVYDAQCTEGTTKQEAWSKREAALSAQFRYSQRSAAQKSGDFYENRRMAIQMVGHTCNAEEELFIKYPKLASTYVMGKLEAMRTCSRYASPETVEESYMASCVDSQNKIRASSSGVYPSSCVEGNAKGRAEQARVAALHTAYRNGWKSSAQRSRDRYAMSAYGRDIFAHGCDHEEAIFNAFPSVAASMRAKSFRY
mmetsp:Transcript_3351/g.6297  ORF Transcript_3351/g.6297 Transcript_3351/m.6297 type:complete len:344 (-) Transcript_3351:634-1665(-)|eukprot:CAMPEP_0184679994 /NCGR_PEP_ID=MMETSP0312-20130426/2853_1 /TAXON_ID=31354 /ORGANISM="Compsopogon coeruleus, Strain SAG 36.94" /LENGTH=343 /DNA_ID=CAMNT_0027129801 /DNA_START=155 /DNA_END=1186 /DNA_ORIENTATION=-